MKAAMTYDEVLRRGRILSLAMRDARELYDSLPRWRWLARRRLFRAMDRMCDELSGLVFDAKVLTRKNRAELDGGGT